MKYLNNWENPSEISKLKLNCILANQFYILKGQNICPEKRGFLGSGILVHKQCILSNKHNLQQNNAVYGTAWMTADPIALEKAYANTEHP
jgi:hypothetical protein